MPDRKTHGRDKCRAEDSKFLRQIGKPDYTTYMDGKARESMR
jgi:hypothetical protein